MNQPSTDAGRPRRRRTSGYVVIGILFLVFMLMATEVIPRSWMLGVLLLMVVLVLMRTTVNLVLDRQERLRRQSRDTPS
jgi:multisubunit Na+/H+ antiporter MnhE subunit